MSEHITSKELKCDVSTTAVLTNAARATKYIGQPTFPCFQPASPQQAGCFFM
jgi:hypothetical protein